jgi:hypothetical protein
MVAEIKMKAITTYKRKRDTSDNKGGLATSGEDIRY